MPYATCNIYAYKKILSNMRKANFNHDIHQATQLSHFILTAVQTRIFMFAFPCYPVAMAHSIPTTSPQMYTGLERAAPVST